MSHLNDLNWQCSVMSPKKRCDASKLRFDALDKEEHASALFNLPGSSNASSSRRPSIQSIPCTTIDATGMRINWLCLGDQGDPHCPLGVISGDQWTTCIIEEDNTNDCLNEVWILAPLSGWQFFNFANDPHRLSICANMTLCSRRREWKAVQCTRGSTETDTGYYLPRIWLCLPHLSLLASKQCSLASMPIRRPNRVLILALGPPSLSLTL